MGNRYSKSPPRKRVARAPIREAEFADLAGVAERDGMTLADVIRERCGWAREDGKPNRPWSNQK